MKSILAKSALETGILSELEALNFSFQQFLVLTKCNDLLQQNFRGIKTVKLLHFEAADSQKLISRKISCFQGRILDGKILRF